MDKLHMIAAASYARLIKSGSKTIADVPEAALPFLRQIAPELFEDGE